jgi:hypothetical protein
MLCDHPCVRCPGGCQQVARAFGPHPGVAHSGAVQVGEVIWQIGELVEHEVGREFSDSAGERPRVVDVDDDRLGAEFFQHRGLLRRPCRSGHHVPGTRQQRDQAHADEAACSGNKYPHAIRAYL